MKNKLSLATLFALLTISIAVAQEYGTASYYSDEFHGLETAYGVKYDKNQLTASHKTHPFGTMLKVTRLDNKKSVTVKVIDKGPWIKGRIVDLSRKAANALDLIPVGVADVKVEVVGAGKQNKTTTIAANKSVPTTPKAATVTVPTARPNDYLTTPKNFKSNSSTSTKTTNNASTSDSFTAKGESNANVVNTNSSKVFDVKSDGNAKIIRQGYTGSGLYKIVLMKPEKKGYGVQVASLTNYENVMRKVAELQGKWFDNVLVNSGKTKSGKKIYKVVLGPFKTATLANNYRKSLINKFNIKGFVVDLTKM